MHVQIIVHIQGPHCATTACHATPVCLSHMRHMLQGVPIIYHRPPRVSDRHSEYSFAPVKSAFMQRQLILWTHQPPLRGQKSSVAGDPSEWYQLLPLRYTVDALFSVYMRTCLLLYTLIAVFARLADYLPTSQWEQPNCSLSFTPSMFSFYVAACQPTVNTLVLPEAFRWFPPRHGAASPGCLLDTAGLLIRCQNKPDSSPAVSVCKLSFLSVLYWPAAARSRKVVWELSSESENAWWPQQVSPVD